MNKKFLSAILAGACALSCMSFAAFAQGEEEEAEGATVVTEDPAELEKAGSKSYSISAGFTAPALNVTIPSQIKAVLNPYGVTVEVDDGVKSGIDGVTSPIYEIVNNTKDFGIAVKATATAKGTTGITIYETGDAPTWETETKKIVKATVKAGATADAVADVITFQDAAKITSTNKATVGDLIEEIAKAEGDEGTKAYIQIGGNITQAADWTTTDKVTLTLVLDIQPKAPAGN